MNQAQLECKLEVIKRLALFNRAGLSASDNIGFLHQKIEEEFTNVGQGLMTTVISSLVSRKAFETSKAFLDNYMYTQSLETLDIFNSFDMEFLSDITPFNKGTSYFDALAEYYTWLIPESCAATPNSVNPPLMASNTQRFDLIDYTYRLSLLSQVGKSFSCEIMPSHSTAEPGTFWGRVMTFQQDNYVEDMKASKLFAPEYVKIVAAGIAEDKLSRNMRILLKSYLLEV